MDGDWWTCDGRHDLGSDGADDDAYSYNDDDFLTVSVTCCDVHDRSSCHYDCAIDNVEQIH